MTGRLVSKGQKGFGFVKPDDGSDDAFLHANNYAGDWAALAIGDRLDFDAKRGRGKCLEAVNIRRVG